MPNIDYRDVKTNSSVDVLNAIRNSASQNYKDHVPIATPDANTIRSIGNVIMDFPEIQNEFLSALINRIAEVKVTNKYYTNPMNVFKKGKLNFGEVIEDIFIDLAHAKNYSPERAETTVFQREFPDVKSAFYVMNYKKFYKATVTTDMLRTAFLSWDGVIDLIGRIVDQMYSAASYDEWLTTKYMLAQKLLRGEIYPVTIAVPSEENAKTIGTSVRALSNEFEFPKTTYTRAGVLNKSDKADQYLIMSSEFDAYIDVNLLSAAFNMDKAEFLGHRVMIDKFSLSDDETARLGVIFDGDPTYHEISAGENALLAKVKAVLVDADYFMIFDNNIKFTEIYNPQGLYWNEFYHRWATFAVSPFANAAALVPGNPTVTGVTVTPSTITMKSNDANDQTVNLTASVATEDFAPQTVTWTSNSEFATVDKAGKVTIKAHTTASPIVITATSTWDNKKSAKCTITLS